MRPGLKLGATSPFAQCGPGAEAFCWYRSAADVTGCRIPSLEQRAAGADTVTDCV